MEKIVALSVVTPRLDRTVNLCVTVLSLTVIMLKDVNSLLGVCTRVFINYEIKHKKYFKIFKNNQFSLEYRIIYLQLQKYIYNVKKIDNMHKSEVSVTDYQIHSTLHWIYKTVTEERIGDVNNLITLTEYSLDFNGFFL